ncbi:hypothetical protein PR202_ga12446 [Eleusine coracana subsp. coracana]|uniref:DEAD-box ATP-dependent RNA helicase 28 n=1 Tax=Eleusine coracana subsp. coracana TaxID=191504 RepID=A0AAV5CC40_ELECO|nr:hypothetical protein PR202_ga12446 [Eleusine coracana subsp. coracana]
MDPSFRFDPDGSDDDAAARRSARDRKAQSAWDFSSYAESVAAEHERRRTTSIDEKISLARQGRRKPVLSDDSEADESGGSGEDDSDEEALVEGESSGDEDELEESEDDEEEVVEGSGDEEEAEAEGDDEGLDEEEGSEKGEEVREEEEDAQEAACIPLALTGRDICGSAITGSGKVSLVHTLQYLLDLAVVILDEADRLLELGFSAEIQELVTAKVLSTVMFHFMIHMCPKRRQTMLFSATMTEEIDTLIKLSLNKPVRLEADPSLKRPATLTEEVIRIRRTREANQEAVLLALCLKTFKKNALEVFKKQEVDFLIATDVAARGIDIVGVRTVINFSCPRDVKTYLHRVGRTARAGREGYAVTFVTDDDRSLLKAIAKKAGSQLKSRIVAEKPVAECAKLIEDLEDQISTIIREEREEMALRKAEMEVAKAENMIAHKEEIYSRPKRTWHTTEREKMLLAKAAKESLDKGKNSSGVISAKQAEDLRLKEKKRREQEKNLPRKKRRRLEAQREMLEDSDDGEDTKESKGGNNKTKKGQSLVDVAYRRAKSMKATSRKVPGAGKGKTDKKGKQHSDKVPSRQEEMHELFQNDMSEWKQGRALNKNNNFARKKSKNAFKSKSRYKRRK